MTPLFWEAIGSLLAGVGSIAGASITFVFYRELTRIERERSARETFEYQRLQTEKTEKVEADFFEKVVSDFHEELLARASNKYPVYEVMVDIAKDDPFRRRVALEALERYLKSKERVPSERDSLRDMILSSLDSGEPKTWPGWESREA